MPHLGDTSCVSFAPAFPPEKPGLKSLRCIAFSGPHRCAPVPILHRFARTPPLLSLRGAKRRDNPFSLRQGIAESSTLGEYERGCEFARSGANLPGISAGTRIATPRRPKVRHAPRRQKAPSVDNFFPGDKISEISCIFALLQFTITHFPRIFPKVVHILHRVFHNCAQPIPQAEVEQTPGFFTNRSHFPLAFFLLRQLT